MITCLAMVSGFISERAGAQPPPPACGGCVDTVHITFTPTTPTTDTLPTRSEGISICAGQIISDSAKFNGTLITGFTIAGGCASKTAVDTFVVGSNTWTAWGCSGAFGGNPGTCASGSYTVTHPALGVNPKSKTVNVTDSSIATQTFTVSNYTLSSKTYTLTLTCTSTVTSCSATPYPSITVNGNTNGTVTVTYRSGPVNTSGAIKLKAVDPSGNADSATVTVNAIAALAVSTAFMNQDDQDMSRCSVSCFAATAALSTVPIISKGLSRGISLVYHGDRVAVRAFLYMDVTAGVSTAGLQDLELSAQYQASGSWFSMTFVNGDQTLHFAGSPLNSAPGKAFRIGAQFDASALANAAWAAAPLRITLIAVYSDHQEFYTDSSQTLSVVSERASPIAYGWSVAGLPHLYGRSDATASQLVAREGDGSTTMYTSNGCVGNCIWMPTGAGVFSRIDYNWPDSLAYVRSWADSTREYFDGIGRLIRRIDRFQDTTVFVYDSATGRLKSISDPFRTSGGVHLTWQIAYGANGIASITEPAPSGQTPRQTTDSLDSSGRLVKWTDPDNVSTRFAYDAYSRLSSVTDRNGNTTTFKYDTLWKLDSVISPSVLIDTLGNGTPSSMQLRTSYSDWQEAGVPWKRTSLSQQWQPARTDTIRGITTDPSGHLSVILPDRWGQAVASVDPLGDTTKVVRDANGMPSTITYPTGAQDQYQYSGGLLVASTPAYQSVTTQYHYGAFALPDSIYGTGIPTTYNYFTTGGRGRIDSTRVGAGNTASHYTYDSFFRMTQVVDPLGDTTAIAYDAVSGNQNSSAAIPSDRSVTTIFDRVGRDSVDILTTLTTRQTTTKFYDSMNRLVAVLDGVHPDTLKYHYDSLYLRKTTDMKGQVYQTTYNALGWPVSQIDAANDTTKTTYNKLGLQATFTNRRGQLIQYSYDVLGRVTGIHKPSIRSEADAADTIIYSAKGDVVRDSNAVQKNVTYYSDAAGWQDSAITTFVTHGSWWKRYYHHNSLGQIDSIHFTTNATGGPPHTRHFGWDAATGVLDSLWVGSSAATHLGYNAAWTRTTTTYPTSVTRADSLSNIGRLSSSTYSSNVSGSFNRAYDYDSAGRMSEVDLPNGTDELYSYSGAGQLAARLIGHWSLADSIQCLKQHQGNGYGCPPADFVTSQQYGYGFDLAGSFDTLSNVTAGTKVTGVSGAGNTDSLWNGVSLTHDKDGNRATNGTSTQYLWSADGLLLQAITGTDTSVYDYNVSGQLTRRQKHGVDDRYYLWDNGQLVAILDQWAEDVSAEYAYYPGTDRPFAQGIPTLSTLSYFEQDGKGNVIGLHTSGAANQSLAYDPWGNLESVATTGGDTAQLRWKGSLWEGGPQLYYMRARWYDPVTRRFVSPDPLGLSAGINEYPFVGGDPINGRDPSGMLACIDEGDDGDGSACSGGGSGPSATFTCVVNGDSQALADCIQQAQNFISAWNNGLIVDGTDITNSGGDFASDASNENISCVGNARILGGNPRTVGRIGGWGVPVASDGAAVIPAQWGGRSALRPYLSQISGRWFLGQFNGITDVIGSTSVQNVRDFFMNRFPGDLIIEIPGGQDQGVMAVTVSVPSALGCPQGTRQAT